MGTAWGLGDTGTPGQQDCGASWFGAMGSLHLQKGPVGLRLFIFMRITVPWGKASASTSERITAATGPNPSVHYTHVNLE